METGATALALDWQSNTDFQYGWQKSLQVDGWKVENIPAGFVDSKSEKSAGLNYDAVFGLPFLRHFFVVFNFPERTMQLLDKAPEKIEGDAVPFSYVADQMIIRATVNDRPANLLVDTGLALPSLRLDTSWALVVAPPQAEGIPPGRMPETSARERGVQPPAPAQPPASPKAGAIGLEVTSLKFANQEMNDLSVTLDALGRRMNLNPLAVRIDGILAAPLMRDFIVSIDFQKSRIYFQKRTDGK
ncbi:MAG: hypothetical protein HYX74_03165 [Acidobacteria bacterium]|nr:hypothetical protein [Acidobacteriota bacterium]